MLEQLANCTTIEEAVMFLLSFDNALSYNKEALLEKYVDGIKEETAIARELAGTSGERIVLDFIKGEKPFDFFYNCSFNSIDSAPLIIRAIQLRIANQK
jgi:hypothetical protein